MQARLFHAERIFDGSLWHEDAVLCLDAGRVTGIRRRGEAPEAESLPGWIVPGLIDLQVNGGGGVLFNNSPDQDGIARICAAHAGFGTTATLVTLITDRPEVTRAALAAGAATQGVPGFLGLHLEGPHIAPIRKGTHDPALIRPMDDTDLTELTGAARHLPHLICTLAPEAVSPAQLTALARAGITVSLGHSDCDAATARASADLGARMVTHLFNAMSPLSHRAPGLVGAALDDGRLWVGLIADGFHVEEAALGIALRAKAGPARIFLVSDAMATVGSEMTGFTLNGRQIFRAEGRLTLADGTLAGADIAQIDGVRHLHRKLSLPLDEALRLASTNPAQALGISDRGHLAPGARADFFCLDPERITALATWIGGTRQEAPR